MDREENVFVVPQTLLLVFQIFGLFPLTSTRQDRVAKILQRSLSTLHCLTILAIFSCCLYFAPNIFDTLNTIGLFVDVLQILAPILAHFIICIEASQRVASFRLFWLEFNSVFVLIQKLKGPQTRNLRNLYFRSSVKVLILFIVPLVIELRILWGISDNYWVYSRLAAQFSYVGCRLSYLQLCLYLQIIQWTLQSLEEETRSISNESRSQLKSVELEMRTGVALRRIQLLQKGIRGVMELTNHLNTCYRWSLTANLTNNFLSIAVAYYWNYRSVYFNNLMYQAESMMVSLPLVTVLCFVMFSCENSFKPATGIIYHLNRITRHPKNLAMHHGVRRMLLQMLNQPLGVNAMNFMEMNFRSLTGFISAMVTYLVIFIQFMPKDGDNAVNKDLVIVKD